MAVSFTDSFAEGTRS